MPNSVTSIGNDAFSFCAKLTSIDVIANNATGAVFTIATSNVTLYAQSRARTAIDLTVKVTSQSGSVIGLLTNYIKGDTIKLTTSPTTNYIFLKWTDKDGKILSTTKLIVLL